MVPKKPFNISSSPAHLQESFGGTLGGPWTLALMDPFLLLSGSRLSPGLMRNAELAIPKVDVHNFQVTAAVAMDHLFGLEQKPFMKIALFIYFLKAHIPRVKW
jgi:hypothetical protein